MISRRGFLLVLVPFLLFIALFPLLALDAAARLAAGAEHQETGNLVLLLFYELTRALRTIVGLALVGLLLARAPDQPAIRALVLFILFGILAYAMGFAGGGYVGPLQERLTRFLLGAGLSHKTLLVVFGYAPWAL